MKKIFLYQLFIISIFPSFAYAAPNSPWQEEPDSFLGIFLGTPIEQIDPCAHYGTPGSVICRDVKYENRYGIEHTASIGIYPISVYAIVANGDIQSVQLTIEHFNANKLLTLLTEKYGAPHQIKTLELTTTGGADIHGKNWIWIGKKNTIRFYEYAGSLDESMVSVSKIEAEKNIREEELNKAKKYKNAL